VIQNARCLWIRAINGEETLLLRLLPFVRKQRLHLPPQKDELFSNMSRNQESLGNAGNVVVRVEELHPLLDHGWPDGHTSTLWLATLAGIFVAYTALRLRHLGFYSLWCDEAFSVFVAKSDWRGLFRQIILDRVHPPLYYMLLKLWIVAVGASVARLRSFSVLFSTLTLVPLWSCMKQMRLSRWLRLTLLFAVACNPFLIFYSQEVRMYSLLCFLSVWSLDLYLKQNREQSSLRILWAMVNVALVMVHVAGLAVVGCELGHAVLARKEFRNRFLTCLPALLALLGWVITLRVLSPAPARVLHNIQWISKPTPLVQWKTIAHLLGSSVGAVVLNLPVASAIWTNRKLDQRFASLFFLLSVGTIASVFAFSIIVKPVWQERYLIVAVIPYYLLVGDSFMRISSKWALRCTLAIAAAGALSLEYDLTHRPDRPVFTRFVIPAGEPIFASDDLAGAPLAIRKHPGEIPIQIIKAASPSNSAGLRLTVRDVSYSIGEREGLIDHGHDIYEREFLYAYDTTPDPMSPPGLMPSSLASYGCSEKELAETHGEGRDFVLLKVNCT